MKQKGMEMPIQIFITLFVLLAVAILVLTLVQNQFSSSTNQLEVTKRSQEFQNAINSAQAYCKNQCQNACNSEQAKSRYCLLTIPNLPINLSGDSNDYDETFLAGQGICEDKVYCTQMVPCDCGGTLLTMSSCKNIMCKYWQSPDGGSLPLAQATGRLVNFMKPGACPDKTNPNHWFVKLYNGNPVCT